MNTLAKSFKIAILGSTRGTVLEAIINAIKDNTLSVEIGVVASNKSEAYILERARNHHLITEYVNPGNLSRDDYDEKLSSIFTSYQIDLIVLIGYMRLLSNAFVSHWRNKLINVHPSLLPAFAGGMDQSVHAAVLESGIKETGCTVHYVTEEVDAGPILMQKKCNVYSTDTIESLKSRVQELEGQALIEVIQKLRIESERR